MDPADGSLRSPTPGLNLQPLSIADVLPGQSNPLPTVSEETTWSEEAYQLSSHSAPQPGTGNSMPPFADI